MTLLRFLDGEFTEQRRHAKCDALLSRLPGRFPLQHRCQELTGERSLGLGNLFGGAGSDDLPATTAAFRAQVYYPVGGFDHVEVVLDDHHRVAVIPQAMQNLQQLA